MSLEHRVGSVPFDWIRSKADDAAERGAESAILPLFQALATACGYVLIGMEEVVTLIIVCRLDSTTIKANYRLLTSVSKEIRKWRLARRTRSPGWR